MSAAKIEPYIYNPNVRKFLGIIAKAEGANYNTLFGGGRFNDLSQHPNMRKEFTQTDGRRNVSSAAGRYQFLKPTWDGLQRQLGLSDFSPRNQDIAATALLKQAGALDDVLKGNFEAAVNKTGRIWASLPSSPYAQPKKTMAQLGLNSSEQPQFMGRIPPEKLKSVLPQRTQQAPKQQGFIGSIPPSAIQQPKQQAGSIAPEQLKSILGDQYGG